jgi:hypothetical protein
LFLPNLLYEFSVTNVLKKSELLYFSSIFYCKWSSNSNIGSFSFLPATALESCIEATNAALLPKQEHEAKQLSGMSPARKFSAVASVEDKTDLQGFTAALLERLISVASSSQGGSKDMSSLLIQELAAKLLSGTNQSTGKTTKTIPHDMTKKTASSKSGAGRGRGRGQGPPIVPTVITHGNARGDLGEGRGVVRSCRK